MKQCWLILALVAAVFSCTSTGTRDTEASAFTVTIVQDGLPVSPDGETVLLKRKPFKIILFFNGTGSIFVHASTEQLMYMLAQEGKWIGDIPGFAGAGMIEPPGNRDYSLVIENKGYSVWQVADEKDSRFDQVKKNDNGFLCTRTVRFLKDGQEGSLVPVELYKQESLYLVLILVEWNSSFTEKIEKKRRLLKIQFTSSP